jgi:hypothetical protein
MYFSNTVLAFSAFKDKDGTCCHRSLRFDSPGPTLHETVGAQTTRSDRQGEIISKQTVSRPHAN